MTYRSYLFDNSYLLGADLKKRSDSAIIKVRSIENEISLSPLKDNINNYNGTSFNLKPIFWGTVHFGADNYLRNGDLNHSAEKVGLHQELLRVNLFQMESHPKNALFPDNVFNLSKKSRNLFEKKEESLTVERKKTISVYEDNTDNQSDFYQDNFDNSKNYDNFYQDQQKIDDCIILPTSKENSNKSNTLLSKKRHRFFDASKKKKRNQKMKEGTHNKKTEKITKDKNIKNNFFLVNHPKYNTNLINSIKDDKKTFNENIEKNKQLTHLEDFNILNKFKKEESSTINFDEINEINRSDHDNNILLEVYKDFREDNNIISIKRYNYNMFIDEINRNIIDSRYKLNKSKNEEAINISKTLNIDLYNKKWTFIILLISNNNTKQIVEIYKNKESEKKAYDLLEMEFSVYYTKFINEKLDTFLEEEKKIQKENFKQRKYKNIIESLIKNNKSNELNQIRKFTRFKSLNKKGKDRKDLLNLNNKSNKIPKELKNFEYCYYTIPQKKQKDFEDYAKTIFNNLSFDSEEDEKKIEKYIKLLEDLAKNFYHWFDKKKARKAREKKNEKEKYNYNLISSKISLYNYIMKL